MKTIYFLLFFCLSSISFSQNLIDLEEIKKSVTDSTSNYYYEKLVYKFGFDPSAMDSLEIKHLYYGKFYGKYKMSDFDKEKFEFTDLIRDKKFKKAIPIGERLLKKDPTKLEVLGFMVQAYEAEDKENRQLPLRGIQFHRLLNTIIENGKQDKNEKFFTVMSIADEYIVSGILGIDLYNFRRSSQIGKLGVTDLWKNGNKKLSFQVIYDRSEFEGKK